MRLVVLRGSGQGKAFQLEQGSNLIGRWDPDSGAFPEIDLEEEDPEAKVSRKHAVIECTGEMVTIEDLGSRNGTYLNRDQKLEPGRQYDLKVGDELIVGKTFLRFEN
ncbi:MAG: FHA domain-containing protein [Oligoflexia bacterium]|nr:FHA domain-containing protein [Oligoflexia bacterium]